MTDDLQASVNYGEVCQRMAEWTKRTEESGIEAAAEDLARYLLLQYPMVRKVTIELEKPGAPVPYAFDTVLIRIARSRHRVLLGIGSNLGDRQMNLAAAIQLLDTVPDVKVLKRSPFVKQHRMAIQISRRLSMDALKLRHCIHRKSFLYCFMISNTSWEEQEKSIGDQERWIWIFFFYDDLILDTPDLQIPHIDLANREFVLKPLSDIAGTFRHLLLNQTVNELLAVLKKKNK